MIVVLPVGYDEASLTTSGIRSWLENYHLYPVFVPRRSYLSERDEHLSSVFVSRELVYGVRGSTEIHACFDFSDRHKDVALLFKLAFA